MGRTHHSLLSRMSICLPAHIAVSCLTPMCDHFQTCRLFRFLLTCSLFCLPDSLCLPIFDLFLGTGLNSLIFGLWLTLFPLHLDPFFPAPLQHNLVLKERNRISKQSRSFLPMLLVLRGGSLWSWSRYFPAWVLDFSEQWQALAGCDTPGFHDSCACWLGCLYSTGASSCSALYISSVQSQGSL